MATIKEIAYKCKVSTATVSKALHNSKELPASTIERVRRAAEKMGYVPNASARALINKKSRLIGVLFVDNTDWGMKHEFFSSILEAIRVEAEKQDYSFCFLSHNLNREKPMSYLESARYRGLDGVVIVSADFKSKEIISLVDSEIPCVTIDYVFNNSTAIMSNNFDGLKSLTEYLISLGHKRIAFLHGEETDVTKKRLAGYVSALTEAGLPVDRSIVIPAIYHDPKTSGRITYDLMSKPDRPTCLIYPDDVSMIGGISAIGKAGLRIPDDVSVAGFDGVNLSRIMRPVFTTFVQPANELGRLSAQKLIARIENPATFIPEVITLNGVVQKGGTAAKAK
ncbi:MAG: LacI family transcriptional regulator [Bacilli bacterium]|jgi:LacI family transcriptional regulator|nr:LacI family transcriptional regulator [Bacilli bacterium]